MNPLTPGPPPPLPGHHQPYHHGYYQPPVAPPTSHGSPPVTQPCFNCGATTHWAQQCPEPRRNMPAGTIQPKPRNRGPKSGPGPIITRYPPPQPQSHPQPQPQPPHYPSHLYSAPPPQAQSPGVQPYQQPYGAPYGAPPPPPPPPHPVPPQPVPGPHYAPAPPPPPPYPPYQGPQYQQPAYPPAPYPHQSAHHHPPPVPSPHTPYYPPPHQYPQTYRGPQAPHTPQNTAPYQFYNPPLTPTHSFSISSQRSANHPGRHRQHSIGQHHPQIQQRHSLSEQSGTAGSASISIVWRPAHRVQRPLGTTLEATEEAEERKLIGFENPNGTISKYWDPDGARTKAHPPLSTFIDDPALKSIRSGYRVLDQDFLDGDGGQDIGREDVAMELENSDDGKPDVTDKLNGILSRRPSEPDSDFRPCMEGEFGRRRSMRAEERRSSREIAGQSPRRSRSKSPFNEDSSFAPYRSRTPNGALVKRSRAQHPLPPKPDIIGDATVKTPPTVAENSPLPFSTTDHSPLKSKEESRGRSRSASPIGRDSEDSNRRHRDYDIRTNTTLEGKGKTAKDIKRRRTSGTNGIPAVFGRRW